METLQQLSNESFSYSWSINAHLPFDAFDDGASFIEMDPDFISKRWSPSNSYDFDFSLPCSQSPTLVHADQIFSNGLLLPLHLVTPPKGEAVSDSSDSVFSRSLSLDSSKTWLSQSNRHQSRYFYASPSRPISANSSPIFHSAQSTPISMSFCSSKSVSWRGDAKIKLTYLGNYAKSPKKILRKYLRFFMPLYNKVKGWRLISSKPVRSFGNSQCTSPRMNNAFSSIEWCRGNTLFDVRVENSIYDAVLHCKKSIGQDE